MDIKNSPPKIILDVPERDDFFSLDQLNAHIPFDSDTDSF